MSGKITIIRLLFILLLNVSKLLSQDFTWIKGSSTFNQLGVYGTQNVSSGSNIPGARQGAVTWRDASDNLWLFGGLGYPASGGIGNLNDLWKFNSVTNEWTWIKGSNAVNQAGVYGSQGVSSSTNTPGARSYSVTWIDASGNLWLFGGLGTGSTFLSDLWKFDPSINEWTWMGGSNLANQSGVYGTKGVSAAANKPGARFASSGWADNVGNLWLFGGNSASGNVALNDLWKYNIALNQWTWVSGSNVTNQYGVYGTQGVSGPSNSPGARYYHSTGIDTAGNLWLFGGISYPVSGPSGSLNDLWKYNPGTNEWTWMKGSNVTNQNGVFGTQGVSSASNVPGVRYYALTWADTHDNLWLFGGNGFASAGSGDLNDLWKYNTATNEWTWIKGSSLSSQNGVYGIQGTSSPTVNPGAREAASAWIDSSENLWLFGGYGYPTSGSGRLNDLWKYTPPCLAPLAPSNTSIVNNQNICANSTTTISAISSGTVSWYATPTGSTSLGSGINYITPALGVGTYTYYAEATTCTVSLTRSAITITVNSLPTISVNSGTICAGQSFTMMPTGAMTYTYSSGTDIVSPTSDATYSVSGTDANGCISSMDAVSSVTVNALPTLMAMTNNTLLCTGETATLSVMGANIYTWSTTETTPDIVVTPTIQTTYTVDGTDVNGCMNTTTITQDVSLCTGIITITGNRTIDIYPNPTYGLFTIELNATSQVTVANTLGQSVLTETMESGKHNLNIQNQSTGIYFIKVVQNGKQYVIKLIKE